ncbi:USP domain-containing protein [Caenorhabditis elegans]|uniref:USP domain-containing protein n=1 Tax=Caenorhabditis elegans TaxID=6239 RepID=G5EF16_CAEEL|nr:USP domain-containing protein [Caenorhabditis elegans]CAB60485.3 USP domain-containing protein [Caenorhabditis elegans]|eukprot:NP_507883.3 Uncharacterized protein CELE_Y113G7A.13 [Caenorhabditis elegans]
MDPPPIIDVDTSQSDFSNNEVSSQLLYQAKQGIEPNNVSNIRNELMRGQLGEPNENNRPPPVDRRDVPENNELGKLPVHSTLDNLSTLSPEPVSTGIDSEGKTANESTTPLPYLLLENPDHLCWLNTILNILHKANGVREKFSTSSTGDPICDSLARIFQGVEKSAESLRLLLTNTKFHTGPQDAAEALISLMHDLKMMITPEPIRFCSGCNTIWMRAVVCTQCKATGLTEGFLLTYEGTLFLISCDKIPVLAPNQEFKIGSERDSKIVSVGYRLNAFAQFISEEKFAHYVAWIRKPEANKEPTTENNDECEHDSQDIQEDINEEQRKINNTNPTIVNNQEVYECQQIVPEIPAEYPAINQHIDNNQNENIFEYSIGEHFICVDDHQISIENVKSIKDYHINVMLLEPFKQPVK